MSWQQILPATVVQMLDDFLNIFKNHHSFLNQTAVPTFQAIFEKNWVATSYATSGHADHVCTSIVYLGIGNRS